jgi:hypothetical protein
LIEVAAILKVVAASFGFWAIGYVCGKSAAFVRAIKSAA